MNIISKTMWGIVLIIIGVIIGLNSLEITNIDIFFSGWWTLFIIIPCFIGIFNEKEGKTGNIIGPIGLSMIFKNTLQKNITEKVNTMKDGLESVVATFADEKVTKTEEPFEGANLDAVFGSITLDICEAKLKNETVIKASSIFGGITIITPKDVEVKVKSTSIFGGVSNHTSKKDSKKIIYIEGFCLFGGIDIK